LITQVPSLQDIQGDVRVLPVQWAIVVYEPPSVRLRLATLMIEFGIQIIVRLAQTCSDVERMLGSVGLEFPYYADPTTGEWVITSDGD
jgi:hypothetical protein